MDKTTQGILEGFKWLASLNPLKPHPLFASVSIGKNSGSFSDDNWNSLEPFAAEFSPDRNAVIVIRRTEKDGSQTLAGMLCRDGEWMQAPANLLLEINQISPDLKKRTATPNLHCADITDLYPDCPATVLAQEDVPLEDQEDEEESEGDHNPAFDPISKSAVTHSASTDAQIAERGQISADIEDMFKWLSTLDVTKDNLCCGIYTGYTEQAFSKANWDGLAQADCSAISADVILARISLMPDGTKKSILMGLKHYGEWEALDEEEIKELAADRPQAFGWISKIPNPTFANIKDIYPDCPVTVLGKNAPQEDTKEEEYDHNPAFDPISAKAVRYCPTTDAQIAEYGRISAEIDDMFIWLSTLDATKDNLHCGIYTGHTEARYVKENWESVAHADCSAISADVVLEKQETLTDGTKQATLMGIAHYGKKWRNLTKEEILDLSDTYPEAFDWVANVQNPTYANIKDIYPSCPI